MSTDVLDYMELVKICEKLLYSKNEKHKLNCIKTFCIFPFNWIDLLSSDMPSKEKLQDLLNDVLDSHDTWSVWPGRLNDKRPVIVASQSDFYPAKSEDCHLNSSY